MSVGERIRFFRRKRGMTQKALGLVVGFPEPSADVRVSQYESGTRMPRGAALSALAGGLGVSPEALLAPGAGDVGRLMQALFVLEDACGASVRVEGEGVVLRIPCGHAAAPDGGAAACADASACGERAEEAGVEASDAGECAVGVGSDGDADELRRALLDWARRAGELASGEGSREAYDEWRCSGIG